jgi:hypothetical protein
VTLVTPLVNVLTLPITLLDMFCMPDTTEAAKAEPGNPLRPPEIFGTLGVETPPPVCPQEGS